MESNQQPSYELLQERASNPLPNQQMPHSATVSNNPIQEQPVVITQFMAIPLGPDPVETSCPSCHASIRTNVITEPTTKTHMLAACLCCLGGLLCFWIPYVTDSCQGQNHYCPDCQAYLGKYDN